MKNRYIEVYLGSGRIGVEFIVWPDGTAGIKMEAIEKQTIGSDAKDAPAVPHTPTIVIRIGKVEAGIVLLQSVSRALGYLACPGVKEAVDRALAPSEPKQKKLPSMKG